MEITEVNYDGLNKKIKYVYYGILFAIYACIY